MGDNKRKLYAKDPSVSLTLWTDKVNKLIADLHIVDVKWFGNEELKDATRKWKEYKGKNDANMRNCNEYLGKINEKQIQIMKTTNNPAREMNDLCQCIFSAPANIRPGYKATNDLVGSHIDPLTTSKPKQGEVIECSDITDISKAIAKEYNLVFLQYNDEYAGGGIVSSDQSPKARELPPKPFSETPC